MPSLRAAALTDIGRVRRNNEDRFLLEQELHVFGVADGVGGLPGGAEAAQKTVEEIAGAFRAGAAGPKVDATVAVHRANDCVLELGRRISPGMGIGTTLTFGVIRDGAILIAHVGDSRCYVSRGAEFRQVTEDHSVENEARLRRAKGEVVYYHESNRNALTRCIGQPSPPDVDLISRPLLVGERYLFCTDGVTRMIPNGELGAMMAIPGEPDAIVRDIVSLAVRRGGPDNATAVLVFIDAL
jgi:protein phosphatase